jgi:RNase P/RNase MRP subunit POP5
MRIKLLPSLKEDKHYLVFQGNKDNVEKALLEFLGILGMSKANPVIIEFKKNVGILSFNRKYADDIKSALVFYNIHTLGISGTIKKAKEKFIKGKV